MPMEREAGVVIVGGGPAGAAAGAALAGHGIPVIILEQGPLRDIDAGATLIPHALPILDRLGVHDAVRSLPHTLINQGVNLATGDGSREVCYRYHDALPPAIPYGYQVRRTEFDAVLVNRARELGADVREGWRACTPLWDGNRLSGLTVRDRAGEEHHIFARAILDATGTSAFLAARMGWRFPYPRHRKMAAFGVLPSDNEGSDRRACTTSIILREHGWFWLIPFADGSASIGVVMEAGRWKGLTGTGAERFGSLVAETPEVGRRLHASSSVAAVQVAEDFSYRVMRMAGDGYALIGDAGGFLDPIFSTGVYLALATGVSAADDLADALARHGRVDGSDLGPTIALTRVLHRTYHGLIRDFYDSYFLSWLFAPPSYLSIPGGITSVLAGRVVGPGGWQSRLRLQLLRAHATAQRWSLTRGRPLVSPVAQGPRGPGRAVS